MKWWQELIIVIVLVAALTSIFAMMDLAGSTKTTPKTLTPQDVLLALEAHEAKCKCGNDDEFAKQFAKTLEGAGIPRLPGVKE